jgi:hypothetical protein
VVASNPEWSYGPLKGSRLEPPFDWTFAFTFSWKESPRHFMSAVDPDLLYMVVGHVALHKCDVCAFLGGVTCRSRHSVAIGVFTVPS